MSVCRERQAVAEAFGGLLVPSEALRTLYDLARDADVLYEPQLAALAVIREILESDQIVDSDQDSASREFGARRLKRVLTMDMRALRIRTNREIADLARNRRTCTNVRCGTRNVYAAVILLAELADHDAELLRRTATGVWVSTAARDLLLDAAQEC